MADIALVSAVLQQLATIIDREAQQEMKLVRGVRKEIKKLTSSLQTIQAVLVEADKRQLKEGTVRVWLQKLRNISYDMDDVLDEWNTTFLKFQINPPLFKHKVCLFFTCSCLCLRKFVLHRDIALKIREINGELDGVVREKEIYNFSVTSSLEESHRVKSNSFADMSKICGRDEEKKILVNKLLFEGSDGVPVISIVGMGGIGKTTLAQLAYNDSEVISNFEVRIWVCVSDPFDEFKISKAIIEALRGPAPNLVELESLLLCVCESIAGKKFLLVLDDVWTEENSKWEPLQQCLKSGFHGSKILVTTRKAMVAHMMEAVDIINIKELSEKECWSMISRLAFFGRSCEECESLEEVGKKIAGKCKGLPLAAKTIGGILRFKKTRDQWKNILDSEMWTLEEFEKGIFPPLLLSYNDLPPMVRLCFSYCAIFPKNYKIGKDRLIRLWMAQGYLGLEQNREMEIIGEEYFDNLATRSFFQGFEKDDDGNVLSCKMHDIVHDFALFLAKNECFTIEVDGREETITNSFYEKVRHSMLILHKATSFPTSICNVKKLRSLVIEDSYYSLTGRILPELFNQLTCLRALDMRGRYWGMNLIEEIPREIGKLMHLRYLNLSKNGKIEELPETICDLYNLQTLDLFSCWRLQKLPQGIGKLINLRHVLNRWNFSLSYMPKGIERLTCLRTLSEFIVCGSGHGGKAGTLECLKNLDHLRGSLRITRLGNVADADEAKRAVLKNKKNLLRLDLNFEKDGQERMNEEDEAVLEALQPSSNLEALELDKYRGSTISPNWLMTLINLRMLVLNDCMNCEHLPPLGKFSSLESLTILKMRTVKRIGDEFLGVQRNGRLSASSVIAFPKLKSLTLNNMMALEEWGYGVMGNKEEDITIMPCLHSLTIGHCPKLQALPNHLFHCLEEFKIISCPFLGAHYKEGTGEDWPSISHIPNIVIYHD